MGAGLICAEFKKRAEEYVRVADASKRVDYELLHAIVEQAEESLKEARLELPAATRAELVVALYDLFRELGHVDRPTILRLVKLAT